MSLSPIVHAIGKYTFLLVSLLVCPSHHHIMCAVFFIFGHHLTSNPRVNLVIIYVGGSMGSALAILTFYPLERVRVEMQLQQQQQKKKKKSLPRNENKGCNNVQVENP